MKKRRTEAERDVKKQKKKGSDTASGKKVEKHKSRTGGENRLFDCSGEKMKKSARVPSARQLIDQLTDRKRMG